MNYILKRVGQLIVTFFLTSFMCFAIIQLPPNDIVTRRMEVLKSIGASNVESSIATLKQIYNLDKPLIVQYFLWVAGFFKGNFGYSILHQMPARTLISQRLLYTFILILLSLLIAYLVAIMVGLYSATHQNSVLDHVFTFLGMIGLGTPDFLIALVFLYVTSTFFGWDAGGFFSPDFVEAKWSIPRIVNFLQHLWGPVVILAAYYAAGLIRIMRARTLDLLREPFVNVARAKGLSERAIIFRHVFPLAVNPLVSIMGLQLAEVVSGGMIVSVVLSLPTLGPLLLESLLAQDMYLGGGILMILIVLLLVGNLLVDITLVFLDPRIRYR
jgi:peptide/nickel transport system permease protein